jgi:putative alpha-1,2-mannosidase
VKVFEGDKADAGSFAVGNSIKSKGTRAGAVLAFKQSAVVSRVGISFISSQKACDSVNREMPKPATLSSIVTETQGIWNKNVLSKVTTTETNLADLQSLYTSLYIMHQMPSNRTGENPLWQSTEPYWDDLFTLWDLYRCSFPLYQILQPEAHEELLRSMIDVWRNDGYLPSARSANFNGPVQGGSDADTVLADAYVKGVRGSINWKDAYAAMQKDAEVEPPNNFDPRANDSSTKEGRGGLSDWISYGFITPTFSRAVSRGVEYSINDFGLYQVARGVSGNDEEIARYWRRSQNWRNYWKPSAVALGFNGFLVPRDLNGFIPQDPLECCGYWPDPYYQGSPYSYSFNAHHDMAELIRLSGGNEKFIPRLQKFFEKGIDPEDPESTLNGQLRLVLGFLFHLLILS